MDRAIFSNKQFLFDTTVFRGNRRNIAHNAGDSVKTFWQSAQLIFFQLFFYYYKLFKNQTHFLA